MTTTSKLALSAIVAGAIALSQTAQAGLINGTVSFAGNVTAYQNTTGTGSLASDFSNAHSLVFSGGDLVNSTPAPTGSFATAVGGSVSVFSPLVISPVTITSGSLLWSITSGSHVWNFTVTSLTESPLVAPYNVLILQGTGTISDNIAGDLPNTGTWVATFTTASANTGVTFSYNSSAAANVNAPEAGTSVLLLGLGLVALGTYAQFRKQVA
jgi:hypothetical protein